MIQLTATTHKLQVVLAAAVAATQLDCHVAYRSHTASGYSEGSNNVLTNGATDVDLVGTPATGETRTIYHVSVWNADTAAATVSVKVDVSGTDKVLVKATLQPGWALHYGHSTGWRILNASGIQVVTPSIPIAQSSVIMPPHFATANLTSTKTITSGSSFAVYMGKAPRALTSVQVRSRVTTAMATITWGEVAIAKGSINIGGNPTLTVVGYADVSGTFNSTGQKTTTVNVSAGQAINEGDDLWVLIGNSATTAAVMRAASIADDLQVGYQASAAQRPSTIVGTGTAFTIEGATTLPAWVALVV